MAEDTEIEVVLARSGLTFIVPPDKSILQVLIDEAIDPLYDCQRGECGICQVAVLDGVPDHRDHILSEAERAARKSCGADGGTGEAPVTPPAASATAATAGDAGQKDATAPDAQPHADQGLLDLGVTEGGAKDAPEPPPLP